MIGYNETRHRWNTFATHRTGVTRQVMASRTKQETLGQHYKIRVHQLVCDIVIDPFIVFYIDQLDLLACHFMPRYVCSYCICYL